MLKNGHSSPVDKNGKKNSPPKKKVGKRYDRLKQKGGSLVSLPTYIRSKNMKVTNNVASLVKKYAMFIFKELNLDKNRDEINQ